MPKARSGSYYWNKARTLAIARPRVPWQRKRPTYPMPNCGRDDEQAGRRAALVSDYAQRMTSVPPEAAHRLLQALAAEADTEEALEVARASIEKWIGGWRPATKEITIEQFGTMWTSGALKKKHGIHIRNLDARTAESYDENLRKWVYPVVGHLAVRTLTLSQSDKIVEVLAQSDLDHQTQRNVLSRFRTLMNYAVQPCRLRESSPLPKGWVPPAAEPKAKGMIYPDDDTQLLASARISIHWRMFWGFFGHEGMRPHNVVALRLANVNLEKNYVRVDKSKTSARILFAMTPGTREAIREYLRLYRPNAKPEDLLFIDDDGGPIPLAKLAAKAREHFEAAGIFERRPELLTDNEDTKKLVAYDYRGAFITVKLAAGWELNRILDHTGHVDSRMIEKVYKRQAETFEQLDLTARDWMPLIDAIPELQPSPDSNGTEPPLGQTNAPGLTKRPANIAISLAYDKFSQDFVLGSQVPDMQKSTKVSRIGSPSSPVQPDALGQTLATPTPEQLQAEVTRLGYELAVERGVNARIAELLINPARIAETMVPTLASGVLDKLYDAGVLARPKPQLVKAEDDDADEDR